MLLFYSASNAAKLVHAAIKIAEAWKACAVVRLALFMLSRNVRILIAVRNAWMLFTSACFTTRPQQSHLIMVLTCACVTLCVQLVLLFNFCMFISPIKHCLFKTLRQQSIRYALFLLCQACQHVVCWQRTLRLCCFKLFDLCWFAGFNRKGLFCLLSNLLCKLFRWNVKIKECNCLFAKGKQGFVASCTVACVACCHKVCCFVCATFWTRFNMV